MPTSDAITLTTSLEDLLARARRGLGATQPETFGARLVDGLASACGASAVLALQLVDGSGDRARVVAMACDRTALAELEADARAGPWAPAFRGEEVVVREGARERHPDASLLTFLGAEAFLALPVRDPLDGTPALLLVILPRPLPEADEWLHTLRSLADLAVHMLPPGPTEAPAADDPQRRIQRRQGGLVARSAERYEAFIARSPFGLCCIEADQPIPLSGSPIERLLAFQRLARLVECNPAFAASQGTTPEALVGTPLRDLPRFRSPAALRAMGRLLGLRFDYERFEFELASEDGKQVLAYDLMPVIEEDCLVRLWAMRHDVTARKVEQAALRESREHLHSVFESALDGIVVLDGQERVVDANRAFLRMVRRTREETLGTHASEFDLHLDATILGLGDPAAEGVPPLRTRHTLRRKDGEVFQADVSVGFRAVQDGRFYCFVQDISEHLAAEERAHAHQAQLAHFSRLNTLGEMASGLAHEINQPLAAIVNYTRGSLRRLRDRDDSDPLLIEALENASAQAERAGQIVRRMRSFVRKGESHREVTDLNEVVRESLALADSALRAGLVTLRLELSPEDPLVKADRIQVEQVLLNLVRNGIEAMEGLPEERRELIVRTTPERGGHARVSVLDSGPGLDKSRMRELFTPFFSTKPSGIGLGLSISHSIIEDHGGRLWAEPHTGGGACFHFTLPVPSVRMKGDD